MQSFVLTSVQTSTLLPDWFQTTLKALPRFWILLFRCDIVRLDIRTNVHSTSRLLPNYTKGVTALLDPSLQMSVLTSVRTFNLLPDCCKTAILMLSRFGSLLFGRPSRHPRGRPDYVRLLSYFGSLLFGRPSQ